MRAHAGKRQHKTRPANDDNCDRLATGNDASGEAGRGDSDSGRGGAVDDGREQLAAVQRARVIAAMIEACAQRGVASVTVADVVARSGVSRRTFYEVFKDREQCFLAALEDAIARLQRAVEQAYDPSERWELRVRNALVATLAFLEDQPSTARLLIVDSLAAGPAALERREQITARAIEIVNEGRAVAKNTTTLPAITAEASTRAALSIVQARINQDDRPPNLLALTNQLMSTIVLPYLGPAAARRQLHQPPPPQTAPTPTPPPNPLKGLNLRLTYRTIRVLNAIAANPGASNRTIGQHAGIADQGQTSKLLTRLQRQNLITSKQEPTRGAPNAWTLTVNGQQIHRHTH